MTRLTVKQTADMLGMSERLVRSLTEQGVLGKAVGKKRKTYLIYKEVIEERLGKCIGL